MLGLDRSDRSTAWETVGVVVLVAGALVLCFLAFTRDMSAPGVAEAQDPVSTGQSPSAQTSATPTPAEPSDPASPSVTPAAPVEVSDQRRVDFAERDRIPDGAESFDNDSVSQPLAVRDGVLQHGAPRGPAAMSAMEVVLSGEVHKLGARIRFPEGNAGSVVLAAWQESFVQSRRRQEPSPASGLRLVVTADQWQLGSSVDGAALASGALTTSDGVATIEVYRRGSTAYVVDPSGTATAVNDARIAELAGPYACWQLVEDEADQAPAALESVWAG